MLFLLLSDGILPMVYKRVCPKDLRYRGMPLFRLETLRVRIVPPIAVAPKFLGMV